MPGLPWVAPSLSENSRWRLVENAGVLPSLSLSKAQSPDFITLIGGPSKAKLLQQLVDAPPPLSLKPHGQVHLQAEQRSCRGDIPKIFIDCEAHLDQPPPQLAEAELGPQRCREIAWADHSASDIAHKLYARVLAPLSSVICYFASDLGGLRGVARLIADQLVSVPPQSEAIPRALIVVDTSSAAFDASVAEARLLGDIGAALHESTRDPRDLWPNLLTRFHEVRVLGLQKHDSPEVRSKVLRRRIVAISGSAHAARRASRTLFSATHAAAFFDSLLDNFCAGDKPFDFIKASRPLGFSLEEFPTHLGELLNVMPSQAWLWHTVAPLVASALFLASYPPESHYFDPAAVFSRLYRARCEMAMMEYSIHQDIRDKFVAAVRSDFIVMFRALVSGEESTAARLHADRLRTLPSLSELKSHRACFCCLMRMPERVLSCGHTFCDTCVQTFGTPSRSEKYTFMLDSCPLCSESDSTASFSFVPPTAGIRILSLDGGGVRGVIELAILNKIHSEFSHFRLSFAEFFDYVCGTSAGGLIVLGLFLMQWTPEQCLEKFEKLAAQTFRRPDRPSSFSRIRQTLLSYVKDCKYESTTIEDTFRALTKSAPTHMFNPLKSGTKVAVTTTTAREVLPCLFANYNGRRRPADIGYQIVRAQKPQDDVLIHEAATCTSAAPWFFKPKVLENLGTFQDGGLQHNNPLGIALCEYRYIWPDKGEPDFALSVGSGTSFNDTRAVFEPQSPVQDGTFRRLFQSFLRNTDGEKAWRDFINTVPENLRRRYHRLNIDIKGQEPDIDDVSSMEHLRHQAEQYISSSLIFKPVKETMFASMFYFELEDVPLYRDGSYQCAGVIFCRMNLCKQARKAFYEELIASSSYFLVDGRPIRCVESIPRGSPLFRKRVEFKAPDMDYQVSITIGGTPHSHYISGLPKTLKDLAAFQKLEAPFGRVDHQYLGRRLPALPLKRGRKRLASGEFF